MNPDPMNPDRLRAAPARPGWRMGFLQTAAAHAAALAACLAVPSALAAPAETGGPAATAVDAALARVEHVVVIYGENRSFDNLYGAFPGADGVAQAGAVSTTQVDVDGSPLPHLPPVWLEGGRRAHPAFGRSLPNAPFAIDAPPANLSLSERTPDLVHRYYQNIEQIDGGRNDRFVAVSDAGALTMGHYDGHQLPLWRLASEFTLADHFFMGTFGGSFMNHLWFACACVASFPGAPATMKAVLGPDGRLLRRADSPRSVLDGPPVWERDGALTPDGFAINTLQPPYQPSGIAPAAGGDPHLADPARLPLPPVAAPTIGDRLDDRGVSWAWYSGGWNRALEDGAHAGGPSRGVIYSSTPNNVNFQPHHQSYNYFLRYAPGSKARARHLFDEDRLIADIDANRLPQVVFYKPSGDFNEHPGYTDVASGDAHIAGIIERIRRSPAWARTLVIVTYDENGGYWDHVAPPQGPGWSDRWGPGTRIPAILISPLVRKGYVDHTVYDTGSIHRLLVRRFRLEPLPGTRERMGDLTNALQLP